MLAALRTPTKAEREEHDVSHVPYRPWCRCCVMGRGLERRHLTQRSDRDGDRPRVFADYGYLSGDSAPLWTRSALQVTLQAMGLLREPS